VLFCGMVVLTVFGECLTRAPGLMVNATNYVKRVVFPLEILPVASLGAALVHGLVSLLVVVAAHVVVSRQVHWTLVLVPLVAAPLMFLILGLTWFTASLGVFFRDLGQLMGLLVQGLMFLTPVFYPLEAVPEHLPPLLRLNPLTPIVDGLRRVVLWGLAPHWGPLAAWTAIDAVIMLAGYAWFM